MVLSTLMWIDEGLVLLHQYLNTKVRLRNDVNETFIRNTHLVSQTTCLRPSTKVIDSRPCIRSVGQWVDGWSDWMLELERGVQTQ